jgi:hypothetical protein
MTVHVLFGKMARTFLRHIRVASWDELKARVLLGVAEINAAPVVSLEEIRRPGWDYVLWKRYSSVLGH